MALKIVRAADKIEVKNLIFQIFGDPGSGKSSIAFSASRPLMFDFDRGAQRSIGRKDTVIPDSWGDVSGLSQSDFDGYDTIVIDTVARALEMCAISLSSSNPKLMRSTGELTLQGYGALKTAFSQWLSKIRSFGKDIILIAHAKEEKDSDDTTMRIDVPGATKSEIIRLSDFIGYVCIKNGKRTIDFNPTDRYTGKNCVNFPMLQIPDWKTDQSWFASIISEAKSKMNEMTEAQIAAEKEFNNDIAEISKISTIDDANNKLSYFSSKGIVIKRAFLDRTKELGFSYNKDKNAFEEKQSELHVEQK
jgi:hypothetical protein